MTSLSPNPSRSITSRRNAQVRRWLSLWESRGIKTHGLCLVAGEKLVNETLVVHPNLCHALVESNHARASIPLPARLPRFLVPKTLFQELDHFNTQYPLLICQHPPIAQADLAGDPEGLELLCPLGDPTNLGALIRSCCAFGVRQVVLLREAAHPFHPKAIRASSGAVFRQPLAWGPRITELDKSTILERIVALDLQGTEISTFDWPKHVRLLVGEEGVGLPPLLTPRRVAIAHARTIDSLNATVAASIALFSYRQHYPLRRKPRRETPLLGAPGAP